MVRSKFLLKLVAAFVLLIDSRLENAFWQGITVVNNSKSNLPKPRIIIIVTFS